MIKNLKQLYQSLQGSQLGPDHKQKNQTCIKQENPFLELFADEPATSASCKTTFDWSRSSIKSSYVIFITGRCGSTLLTRLIRATQLAGDPNEYFNVNYIKKSYSGGTLSSYLDQVVRTTSSNGSFGFEIDWIHLCFLEPLLDFDIVFPPVHTTFFYMTRRDIVAQAWSFASAKATGIWQNYAATKDVTASHSSTPALYDKDIWHEILLILEAELRFEQFFKRYRIKPTRIDYEMLMASRRDVLGLMLLKIGCDPESIVAHTDQIIDQTLKIPRDQFASILNFRCKYANLLSAVQSVRGSNYVSIQRSLKKQGLL
ncbi:MAG: Stf0 family sulfotransferase [Cyanobacteriota bacterium]|jgi:LPS sulfotransferase NodH